MPTKKTLPNKPQTHFEQVPLDMVAEAVAIDVPLKVTPDSKPSPQSSPRKTPSRTRK
jgi:hypothetical protein